MNDLSRYVIFITAAAAATAAALVWIRFPSLTSLSPHLYFFPLWLDEDLIQYGWEEDVWFHVDNYSSAHVYLRMQPGQSWESIPEDLLIECCQLVKANSIEGCKLNDIDVVYTPWNNLKKTGEMVVGQVGFFSNKAVKKYRVERKSNEIVNRLNKTKVEKNPDLRAEREEKHAAERTEQKKQQKERDKRDRKDEDDKKKIAELKSYDRVFKPSKMTSNARYSDGVNVNEAEEDFM